MYQRWLPSSCCWLGGEFPTSHLLDPAKGRRQKKNKWLCISEVSVQPHLFLDLFVLCSVVGLGNVGSPADIVCKHLIILAEFLEKNSVHGSGY